MGRNKKGNIDMAQLNELHKKYINFISKNNVLDLDTFYSNLFKEYKLIHKVKKEIPGIQNIVSFD
jgi:inhibitor of KinA sporulation pathway (predicted exonuclease)